MSKADLKAAMESLQVKKPLKLSSSAPSFTPPTIGIPVPTPVGNQTQDEDHTEVAKPTAAQSSTRVEKPTPVDNHTELNSATLSRRATEQDSSVILEARAVDGLEKGYTRLPNTTLMRLASGDFTKNEIKLALLIARFTISFQRKHAPLSKTVLERRSGIRGAAVLEALSGLVSKGLIEKIQGDQNRPNQLGLVLPLDWDQLMKPARDTEATTVANSTQVEKSIPTEVPKSTAAGVRNSTYFKDTKTIENKLSLSQLPETLRGYFAELKPAKKRESEWNSFRGLLEDYGAEDIADCFAIVQKRGVGQGENHQPCHSPMAFLAKAIAEIMPEVEIRRRSQRERQEHERREAEAHRKRAEEEASEAAEWELKERAFEKAFPNETQRDKTIAEKLRGSPFRPNTQVGRIMAIGIWWDEIVKLTL